MASLIEPNGGFFDGLLHRFSLRVYYEDTDLTGAVYHANYLRWFERARSDMLRLLGIDQRGTFEAGGGSYAVAELSIRYVAPARLDDAVVIESRVEQARAASCRLSQRALRSDTRAGTLVAEAMVRVGFIGSDGRPRPQPEPWRRAFASLVSGPKG